MRNKCFNHLFYGILIIAGRTGKDSPLVFSSTTPLCFFFFLVVNLMQTLWGLDWSLSPTTPRCSYVFNTLLSQMPLLLLLPSFPALVGIPPLLFFPSYFHCPCWLYFLNCLYCHFHRVSGRNGINTCIPFARFNQRNHQCDI